MSDFHTIPSSPKPKSNMPKFIALMIFVATLAFTAGFLFKDYLN